jgi:NADH dehydrogenase
MIAHRLLARGDSVRVLVRPGSAIESLTSAGAQEAKGDLKDPPSLEQACAGVDAVITTANSTRRMPPDTVEAVDLKGNHDLIDSAKAAGVQQFVFISAFGARFDHPAPFLQAKALTEQHLMDSGLDYTILAPEAFMEVWVAMVVGGPAIAGQPVTLVGGGTRPHSFVSVEDVAQYAVAAVGNSAAIGQTLTIGGPESLSWKDVVRIYERVLGRSIPIRTVAMDEPIPGLPEGIVDLLRGLETYESKFDMGPPSRTFGVQSTPLEEFARSAYSGGQG